jgi:hypothetical protein
MATEARGFLPPQNEIGSSLLQDELAWRDDRVALVLHNIVAYSAGFVAELRIHRSAQLEEHMWFEAIEDNTKSRLRSLEEARKPTPRGLSVRTVTDRGASDQLGNQFSLSASEDLCSVDVWFSQPIGREVFGLALAWRAIGIDEVVIKFDDELIDRAASGGEPLW